VAPERDRPRRRLSTGWLQWAFVVAALSFAAWHGVRALTPSRRVDAFTRGVALEAQRMRELRAARIARLTFIPADDRGRVDAALQAGLSDPHRLLTDASRDALLRTLGDHLAARAAESPAEYLALADREKTRWIGPDDSDDIWRLPLFYHERVTGRVPSRTEAREALKAMLELAWAEYGVRIKGVGVGDWGTSIHVGQTREQNTSLVVAFPAVELDSYWDATATVGDLRYRVPRRSYADVLRDNGSVVYAIATTVAESERGVRYPLVSRWYWDPQLHTWHCSSFAMKNVAAHIMWY